MLVDCLSVPIGHAVGGLIGGAIGGPEAAPIGAQVGSFLTDLGMFLAQNQISQDTPFPAAQVQACCRLWNKGAAAVQAMFRAFYAAIERVAAEIIRALREWIGVPDADDLLRRTLLDFGSAIPSGRQIACSQCAGLS